jgi:uncharacterized protein YdiU (UPF0061 family)
MKLTIPFDNSFAALGPDFFTRVAPEPLENPELILFNAPLADELGLEGAEDAAQVFSGNTVPQGADPIAQLYAGHQFGQYNPQLGDGRALLLGEVMDHGGRRRDIQLKGSGRTPYSRGGDGRAWLGPVLREYVISEAMHALGIPTTRALAAVRGSQPVYRETPLPSAMITRTASSHLRVGTFSVFAYRGETQALRRLTDYAMARHYPAARTPLEFLQAVCDAQADLIAAWMAVGFIHGVMNTDNCAISGETIDYGPCAFMDGFHQQRVFSSIDRNGRYAYGNQPSIAVWNMAQLATALVQLFDDKEAAAAQATHIIHAMPERIEQARQARFAAKLGIAQPDPGDSGLILDLLDLMQGDGADFTNVFAALTQGTARDEFLDRAAYDRWHMRWQDRIGGQSGANALMARSNPQVIPRTHRIEAMITDAVKGDYAPLHRLMAALADPFDCKDTALRAPPREDEIVPATFCGT